MESFTMQKYAVILSLVVSFGLSSLAVGQDKATDGSDIKKEAGNTMAMNMTISIINGKLKKGNLSEEQTTKTNALVESKILPFLKARENNQSVMTIEQRRKYTKALKQAENAKYSPKEAEAYAMKKLKFSDDEKKAIMDGKMKIKKMGDDVVSAYAAILTPEQQELVMPGLRKVLSLPVAEKKVMKEAAMKKAAQEAMKEAEKNSTGANPAAASGTKSGVKTGAGSDKR